MNTPQCPPHFGLQTISKSDFAALVFPYVKAATARAKLHELITAEPKLLALLQAKGWTSRTHLLTMEQLWHICAFGITPFDHDLSRFGF